MTAPRSVPALLVSLLAAGALAAPAGAASATVPNACQYKFDGYWRTLDVTTSGVAGPNPVTPGGTIGLTQTTIHADMPTWIAEYGYNLGLLKAGRNEIPARVWVALAGTPTAEAVQVRELATTAVTEITVQPDGTPRSTPLSATVSIPDTSWVAGGEGVASFAQAGPGTLPELPVGLSGALVKPAGSVYISAQLQTGLRFDLDCQPGSAASAGSGSTTFTPAAAAPFATTGIGVPVALPPADPNAGRPAAIRSTALRRDGRRVRIKVACRTTTPCAGRLRLVTARRVRAGKRRRVLELATARFTAPAGTTAAVRVTLTRAARRYLAGREQTAVRVRVVPEEGAAVSKRLVLRGR